MSYQDIWKNGQLVEKGIRECESRYLVIQSIAKKYKRPFTVLDIGANQGYFTIRLAEEFPNCTVVAIEPADECELEDKVSHLNNVIVLKKSFSIEELQKLSQCEYFDLILCMSVIHCFDTKLSFQDLTEIIKSMGSNIILELPIEQKALQEKHQEMLDLIDSLGPPLASFVSHVDSNLNRPMFLLKGTPQKDRVTRYDTSHPFHGKITSSFKSLKVQFFDKEENRDWIPGINLWTYLRLNGTFPIKENLVSLVKQIDWQYHKDVRPWNVIVSGNKLSIIDNNNPLNEKLENSKEVHDLLLFLENDPNVLD
jgi:hypothetical protein